MVFLLYAANFDDKIKRPFINAVYKKYPTKNLITIIKDFNKNKSYYMVHLRLI